MHRKIGILGGLSPESTVTYYEHITRTYSARFGDYGYPEVLIYSVNFQQYVDWQKNGQWAESARHMAEVMQRLHAAGADFGLIATNTMHIVFDEVQASAGMPLLSIMDVTAAAIVKAGIGTVGLLGTMFTMREGFFRDALTRKGIQVVVPGEDGQRRVHDIIYNELCGGVIRDESRVALLDIIGELQSRGAGGVILGCTELPLLVGPSDCALPLFNTTILHAEAALELACAPAGGVSL